jgi:hypothetical protein
LDYDRRRALLSDVKTWTNAESLQAGLASLEDGRCKLYVTYKALQFRRENEGLFRDGSYLPLTVSGEYAQHVLAYARKAGSRVAIVVVPRLSARLTGARDILPLGEAAWGDTRIEIPNRLGLVVASSPVAAPTPPAAASPKEVTSQTPSEASVSSPTSGGPAVPPGPLRNLIAMDTPAVSRDEDGAFLLAANVFAKFPVALLTSA